MLKKHRDASGMMVGVIGVLAALTAMVLVVKRALHSSGRPDRRRRIESMEPQLLKRWILGRTRQSVAAILGPPPITTPAPAGPDRVTPERAVHWRANVWYYPLLAPRRQAMAIRFEEGIARSVEFIEPPGLSGMPRQGMESG